MQVLLTMHANLFDRLPFLKNKHPQFLEQLIPHLKLEFYSSGEYVIWQGDHSSDMYFVGEGLLEVRVTVDVPPSPATIQKRTCPESPRLRCQAVRYASMQDTCYMSSVWSSAGVHANQMHHVKATKCILFPEAVETHATLQRKCIA